MFEPTTYQEKRSALNEMLLQQLVNVVLRGADAQTRAQMQMMLEQYGRGGQLLRDGEAARLLGPVEKEEGVQYADAALILEYLKANVGRTYFGTEEHTSAPDGSIGTAGFGKKFNEWLSSLPAFDQSVSPTIQSGFYRDEMTRQQPLPILVIRHGDEMTVVLFSMYVSVMTLNLARTPAGYNWEAPNHYPLRGEMYTYRGNLTVAEFEAQFAAALSMQGIGALHTPKLPEATEETGRGETATHVILDEAGDQPATDTPAE